MAGASARAVAAVPKRKLIAQSEHDRGDSLWWVSTDGGVERSAWPPEGTYTWTFTSEVGSDRLTPSPDGARVAYVEKRSLAIRDIATGKTIVIHRSAPQTDAAITAWSPDGGELLYATMPHPPRASDAEADTFQDDPTYHRHDLRTGRTAIVVLPGIYAGWLATGEIVVAVSASQKLVAVHGGTSRDVTDLPFHYSQVNVSADGMRMVASASREGERPGETMEVIVGIDAHTAKTTPLTRPSGYAEQQWPAVSPGRKQLAYIRTTHPRSGVPTHTIVVDGRDVTAPASEPLAFTWLDDDAIALERRDGLVVIDATTGEVRRPR